MYYNSNSFKTHLRRFLCFSKWAIIPIIAFYCSTSCSKSASTPPAASGSVLLCDAEQMTGGKTPHFVTEGIVCTGGIQSQEAAYEGNFSCKLQASDRAYGMNCRYQAQPSEKLIISVRHKSARQGGRGVLSVKQSQGQGFYAQTDRCTEQDENGWCLLELTVYMPYGLPDNLLEIYVWTDQGTHYFDQLQVRNRSLLPAQNAPPAPDLLQISMDTSAWAHLENQRLEALRQGLLLKDKDSWAKGLLLHEGDSLPMRLRLKGDWTDHLQGDRWSFRLRIDGDSAYWKRMREFSLQSPQVRGFLKEWFLHRWCLREDVLAPRYDFVRLQINENQARVYAYEEHFLKHLPERNRRREGVIVRMDETDLWNFRQHPISALDETLEQELQFDRQASINAFEKKRIKKNPALGQYFDIAHGLLEQYRLGKSRASEVFDVGPLSKYYAISDICQAYHGLVWHNRRFYYNPILDKLEPICYDGYDGEREFDFGTPFNGYFLYGTSPGAEGQGMDHALFHDEEFLSAYIQCLDRFTRPEYLDSLFDELAPEWLPLQAFLQTEFPGYYFEPNFYRRRAETIRYLLQPNRPLRCYSLPAKSNDSLSLCFVNRHCLPLELVAWGTGKKQPVDLKQPLLLACSLPGHVQISEQINLPDECKYLFYKVLGLDSLYRAEVSDAVHFPAALAPGQDLFRHSAPPFSCALYEVAGKEVRFRPGKHRCDRDLLFPKGYTLYFPPGTHLDLVRGAKFISYSPVQMLGTENRPIVISSSDRSAQGFTVLQTTPALNMLRYVLFEGLGHLDYKGWELPGAVTFYESKLECHLVTVRNNRSEDALNLVRCSFLLRNCTISLTPMDGLDADFCTGKIEDCRFVDIGNDAMDFSTGFIQIKNLYVFGAGDKGISVGEETHLVLENAYIENANYGLVSKDLSDVLIRFIEIKNCLIGIAAYQKKPEYGGAHVQIDTLKHQDLATLSQIDSASSLDIDKTF